MHADNYDDNSNYWEWLAQRGLSHQLIAQVTSYIFEILKEVQNPHSGTDPSYGKHNPFLFSTSHDSIPV